MKKSILLLPFVCVLFSILLTGYSSGPGLIAGVEGTGASGTPGCSCHSPSATPDISVTIQLLSGGTPVSYYFGGDTYTVRLSGLQSGSAFTLPRFGFQLAAVRSLTTVNAGTFTPISGTHFASISGLRLLEQSTPRLGVGGGGPGTTYTVDFVWTAPPAGTGAVTLHGLINAVNSNGIAEAGDKWNINNIAITERERVGPIIGTTSICVGSTSTLSDSVTGGTWTSSAPGIASITSTGGLLTAVTVGTAIITYDAGLSGTATTTVTILPAPGAITGPAIACVGTTATFTNPEVGGAWSSSSPAIATIGSLSGAAVAVAAGTTVITYRLPSGCYATHLLTVEPVDAGTITGPTTVCVGFSATLTNLTAGGIWSASNSTATIGSLTGIVTGVSVGLDTITYSITNTCGVSSTTRTIAVLPSSMCSTGAGSISQATDKDIIVLPNPSQGIINISISSVANEQALVVVTNIFGQIVRGFAINTNQKTDVLLNQPAGIYYITATTPTHKYYTKVLVQ